MGARLSMEVKKYTDFLNKPFKLSFIGHSMGGIIIRSALKYLRSLEDHFHAYISLCSPHLGYLYGSSTLVEAALWYMNNFDKYTSML
jgi:alpha-beta hydrolase superfamily lysophospholipase